MNKFGKVRPALAYSLVQMTANQQLPGSIADAWAQLVRKLDPSGVPQNLREPTMTVEQQNGP